MQLPAGMEYLWLWFAMLHRRRQGGFGPSPISYGELASWSALTGVRPTHREVGIIMRLDDLYLERRSG